MGGFPLGKKPEATKQASEAAGGAPVAAATDASAVRANQTEQQVSQANETADAAHEEAKAKVESGTTDNPQGAFGKVGIDENVNLQTDDQVQALKDKADAESGMGLTGGDLEAAERAEQLGAADDGKHTYTTRDTPNWRFGRFQFEKGVLVLDSAAAQEFEKLLATADAHVQNQVIKIDVEAGERISKAFRESAIQRGVTTAGIDPNSKPAA